MFMLEPSYCCLSIKYQVKPIKDHKESFYLEYNFLTLNIQLAARNENLNLWRRKIMNILKANSANLFKRQ